MNYKLPRFLVVCLMIGMMFGRGVEPASAISIPTVETKAATSISESGAVLNGHVIDNGGDSIIERRFDWGTSPEPSDGWTSDVSVSGNYFSYYLSGLNPGTTYYFRAWAKNSAGWGEGEILSFTTPQTIQKPPPPDLTSPSNGASGVSLTPTFQWSKVSNADYYGLYISEPPYGQSNLIFDSEVDYGQITETSLNLSSGVLSQGVTYYWNVRAHNSAGWGNFSESRSFTVVSQTNQPPNVSLSADPNSGKAPLNTTFYMSASDSDGSISAWVLDVNGDGSADYSGSGSPPSSQQHTYTDPGNYSVALVVSDNDDESAVDTKTVVVGENKPPTCTLSPDKSSGAAPLTINFSISAGDPDGSISSWELLPGDGSPAYSGSGNPPSSQSHTYTSAGTYNAILGVTDGEGATTFDTRTIEVTSVSGEVTLTLYVHEGSKSGPVISGAAVEGEDGEGASFQETTNASGYVTLHGAPGTWAFTASKSGCDTNSWTQSITGSDTKHASLQNCSDTPTSTPTPIPSVTPTPTSTSVSDEVTLTLYVHDGSRYGPVISRATVEGEDGEDNSFRETTNASGYVTLHGAPGTWAFTVSKSGCDTNSWTQSITGSDTKHASLQNCSDTPTSTPTPISKGFIQSSPSQFSFSAIQGDENPPKQTLSVWNPGSDSLEWEVYTEDNWLTVSPTNGVSNGETDDTYVSVNIGGMDSGEYEGSIIISIQGQSDASRVIPVSLHIDSRPNESDLPDLTVTKVEAPSGGTMGDTIPVQIVVANVGSEESGPFHTLIALSPESKRYGTGISLADFSMDSLGVDEQKDFTFDVSLPDSIPSAGDYCLTAFVDRMKRVSEQDEENNVGSSYPEMITIKAEVPTISEIIAENEIDRVKVTVDGESYYILTLENLIDPNTLEVIPYDAIPETSGVYYGKIDPNTGEYIHIYVDSQNRPVSDKKIAAKIGFIDLARKKANKENIAQQIEDLSQVKILFTKDFLVHDMVNAFKAGLKAIEVITKVDEIKDALNNIKSIKDLPQLENPQSGLITDGAASILRKAIWDPMGSMREGCRSELQAAQDYYEESLGVITENHGKPNTYASAKKFLWNYMHGKAHSEVAKVLLDKVFGNYKNTITLVGVKLLEEGLWTGASKMTWGLSGFVKLTMEAKNVAYGTIDADSEYIKAVTRIESALSSSRLHEAAPYTLELANSPLVNIEAHSPVELRIYDSEGRVTGIVNGEERTQIPYSVISGNKVTLFSPYDSYTCEIGGLGEGSYDLSVTRSMGMEKNKFKADNFRVSSESTHRLHVDWGTLSRDSNKIPIQIDSDGDGMFEKERTVSRIKTGQAKLYISVILFYGFFAAVIAYMSRQLKKLRPNYAERNHL